MSTQNLAFADTVEAIDAGKASVAGMFGGDLQKASSDGYARSYGMSRQAWDQNVLEAEKFVHDIVVGRRGIHQLAEAMSTSLFPNLFADSLDRQLYGAYLATPTTWSNYARRATVNDFRQVKRFATTGIRGLLKPVPELDEHERRHTSDLQYAYSVKKYEAGFGVSFEVAVNDDLGMLERLPQDLAQSARDSEEYFVTGLFVGPSGPLASVFNTTTGAGQNVLTGNPPLTRAALQTAITLLMKRRDERGNPIMVQGVELVVGPGLALQAQEIINATEYRIVGPDGNVTIVNGNGVAANLRVNVNFYLPSIATTANADTSWFVIANPSTSTRPAMEIGFLRGYEQPALYEKIPDMRRIGGGGEVPWSFNHGAMEKKVQHVYGGSWIDPIMAVASSGQGS